MKKKSSAKLKVRAQWEGVIPAITTPFRKDGELDHKEITRHCRWMAESGSIGIVPCGSLGEGATLTFDEKVRLIATCVSAVPGLPIIPGIASLSTDEAVALAIASKQLGCGGLMVLPPYVYSTDWREMKAHVSAVIGATDLPCMLYNNPPAYKTDFLPEQVAELAAAHKNLEAIKESSGDARRITALKNLLGNRLTVLVGMDDCIVEGVAAGARGWIAGLVNAFPEESVELYEAAMFGDQERADELYDWFLPLLRLDTVPKFVQHIKWIQAEVRGGNPAVRGPRLALAGADLALATSALKKALKNRPKIR
ncbi:MAG: dihydrodipicolinate synthase family protein [Verrucomicrobia bacterium]|nr:dihydrodipicolinate synthase family protein [Verrucomicrobiota bacterium]